MKLKKASLYRILEQGKVKCGLCERACLIFPGKRGHCQTRLNRDGTLYSLVYGRLAAIESRPIEIKPFFHYYPGSSALTFASLSCNFHCPWCQNFHLSSQKPDEQGVTFLTPQKLVEKALAARDEGVCGSFTEPTLLYEFDLELFKLAREVSLYCCFVSNGYMSQRALEELVKAGLSGLKVDIKGDSKAYQRLGLKSDVPWRNIKLALEAGVHVEVVALLVTNFSDSSASVSKVVENHLKFASSETPLHFTRYFPAYRYQEPSTSMKRLEQAYDLAKKAGIEFVYIGNVPGHPVLNTFCPNCHQTLIKRTNWQLLEANLTEDNTCPGCGRRIPIKGSVKRN